MPTAQKNLYIEQGATFTLPFRWATRDPDFPNDLSKVIPHDLTDCVVRMQIRQKYGTEVLLEANTENGKIIVGRDHLSPGDPVDPSNGWLLVRFEESDTDTLELKAAKYDLEVVYPGPDPKRVERLFEGEVTISQNITRAEE